MAYGSVVKKGERYYGVFYIGPKQVWRTLGTTKDKEAHRKLRELMRSVDRGRYRETAPITFNDFAERYLAEYAEVKLMRGDMKESTLDSHRSMLAWGVKVGYLALNPAAEEERARVERHEMDFLAPEEIRVLLGHAREPYATLFFLAVFSGLRRGELLALQWGDVDWTEANCG